MKIDVNCNEDIERWAARLGVTRTRLIAVVAAAGPDVRDVEARLDRERARRRRNGGLQPGHKRAFHAFD